MARSKFINILLSKRDSWLKLSGYLSLSGLFATSSIIIDANMVAPLGPEALAALGLASSLFAVFMAPLFGLGTAAQMRLSSLAKKQDDTDFTTTAQHFLIVGLIIAIVLVPVFYFNLNTLLNLLARTSGIQFASTDYLQILIFALPLQIINFILGSTLSVRQRMREELRGFYIEVPLNILLNALLIYGLFGAPKLGIAGAAIATICAGIARMAYLVWVVKDDIIKGLAGKRLEFQTSFKPSDRLIMFNITALILGAQAYMLLFAQYPYLWFAALALLFPWLSVTNVFGRGNGLAAAITAIDQNARLNAEKTKHVLSDTNQNALWLSLAFLVLGVCVILLSFHVYGAVRLNAIWLLPVLALLVYLRFRSVTIAALLRASGEGAWVARFQILLQWGIALPLLVLLTLAFDLPLQSALALLLSEEGLRLWWMRKRITQKIAQLS
jgi:Na+-driven multidrug efflux pump